ncbi:MAG: outer membrane lipoprotein carrier protein LolA [Prevotellaceae bacterium]|jgi:outer membrane lipoprotein-sorting protein|nr:outer membrane lipoprotein carrier protein LolA [Prevotellaceae bacterium]
MNKIVVSLSLMMIALSLNAQNSALIEKIKATNASRKTLTATFTQTKVMAMMDAKLQSGGQLYFKADDKLAMFYTKPNTDFMVINGANFVMNSGGKRNVVNTENNPQSRMLKNTLLLCLKCDIQAVATETAATISSSETSQSHVFTLVSSKNNQIGYNKVTLTISKQDFSLQELRLDETNGNYTVYTLSERQYNNAIDASKFAVKGAVQR